MYVHVTSLKESTEIVGGVVDIIWYLQIRSCVDFYHNIREIPSNIQIVYILSFYMIKINLNIDIELLKV